MSFEKRFLKSMSGGIWRYSGPGEKQSHTSGWIDPSIVRGSHIKAHLSEEAQQHHLYGTVHSKGVSRSKERDKK